MLKVSYLRPGAMVIALCFALGVPAMAAPREKLPILAQITGDESSLDTARIRVAIIRRMQAIPGAVVTNDETRAVFALRVTIVPIGPDGGPERGIAMSWAHTNARYDCEGHGIHAQFLSSGVVVLPNTPAEEEATAFLLVDEFEQHVLPPLRQSQHG
jgi:hypothetical protein